MWSAIVAVIGTLAGVLVTGIIQRHTTRAERAEARAAARQEALLAAVAQLTSALADHRRQMWDRENLRLTGAGPSLYQESRKLSHATRSAMTVPLTTVCVLSPALRPAAEEAARAVYAIRDLPDHDTLNAVRRTATEATDRLIAAAGHELA
ncbi:MULTISPECIES: hypothetical protein [Streptomyces]|uniref:Protein kilB n=2 Tax=Streptomyces TaxID=1883 RepID=A0A6G4AGU0_9ACTN|nr:MULTISPECIES: hypothetical protein [Streptomyces]EXU64136.1 protein kilB [Streptomyces sp. PRh5]NEW72656.1 protein kilB [Streptomyces rhizosphaericus]